MRATGYVSHLVTQASVWELGFTQSTAPLDVSYQHCHNMLSHTQHPRSIHEMNAPSLTPQHDKDLFVLLCCSALEDVS